MEFQKKYIFTMSTFDNSILFQNKKNLMKFLIENLFTNT